MRAKPQITELRFERAFDDLRRQVAAAVSPFGDRDASAKAGRLARAEGDFAFFCRTYLPHYFDADPAPFHCQIVALASRRPDPAKAEVVLPVVVAAPRGFAKSTVLSFGFVLWETLFGRRAFAVIGSETKQLAADLVVSIAAELAENPRIIYDFGRQLDYTPKAADIELARGARILGRGAGQQLRGLKHKAKRPDLAVLDDLESDKLARSPERVQAVLDWIVGVVYPALDPAGSMIIVGTLLGKRAALARIITATDKPFCGWVRRLYRAQQDDGSSLWPAKYPPALLAAQREAMGETAWRREKQNDPPDDSDVFRLDSIQTYDRSALPEGLEVAGFYDPRMGGGDYAANVVLGRDRRAMITYVLHARIRHDSPQEALRDALAATRLHGATRYGVETNGFQALCLELLPALEAEAGLVLPVAQVKHTTNKDLRIQSLAAPIERGVLRFDPAEGDQQTLINQLASYPHGHDDGPDALEGAYALLQGARGAWPAGVLPAGGAA